MLLRGSVRSVRKMSGGAGGVELAKKLAAYRAVDEHVTRDGMKIGVGSGSTVVYVAERLGQLQKEKGWRFKGVATSFQAKQLIVDNGLILTDLTETSELDLAIDGADEADAGLNLIKGGGGCQTQEKIVASAAPKLIVVADYRKESPVLGRAWKKGVPIEVIPMSYRVVAKKLEGLGGKAVLRMAVAKAGPVVTDSGNLILDADFGEIVNPQSLDTKIRAIPGVVETGLFVGPLAAAEAYFGLEDGTVKKVSPAAPLA